MAVGFSDSCSPLWVASNNEGTKGYVPHTVDRCSYSNYTHGKLKDAQEG